MKSWFIIMLILYICYSCSVSPRYTSKNNNSIKNVSSRNNTKIVYKSNNELKGVASWYGPNFHGKLTANGEVFDQYGLTAAHRSLPLNTYVIVKNLDNKKSIILRINDRGPFVDEHLRILDCSYGAAKKLDFLDQGTANVELEIIELGDGVYMHHND